MKTILASVLALSVAFTCLPPVSAQEPGITPAAVSETNSVEITDQALRQVVAVVSDPELTAEKALAAFETASQEMDRAIMLAKMDLAQARKDLDAYTKSGKADEMDGLMEKASNKKLQKLLQEDEAVAKAFVKYITSLGAFDRLLNSAN